MTKLIYTGIGSRQTPPDVLTAFSRIAAILCTYGWTLRSGGAGGADSAFETGVHTPDRQEIYLPWSGFNNNGSPLCHIEIDAYVMAAKFHPNWKRCSAAARMFHARNCYQALGYNLATPSNLIICWTPGGKVAGGTGQTLRIAEEYQIPIINFGGDESLLQYEEDVRQFTDGVAMAALNIDKVKFPNMVGDDPVSGLKIMQSAAGYYIGRSYWDRDHLFEGPFSRESGYYATNDEAQADLDGQCPPSTSNEERTHSPRG